MKKMKRLLGLALASIMVLSLVLVSPLTALAAEDYPDPPAEGYGNIIINKPDNVSLRYHTYYAYRIFELEIVVGEEDEVSYNYTLTEDFKDISFTPSGSSDTYDKTNIAAFLQDQSDNAQVLYEFTEYLLGYIEDNDITTTISHKVTTEISRLWFSNVPLGYYMITRTADSGGSTAVVAACALATTDPQIEITLKADAPKLRKKVLRNGEWMGFTSVSPGEILEFKLSSPVPAMDGYGDTYVFTVHDQPKNDLTFDRDTANLVVTVGGVELTEGTDYTYETHDLDDNCAFHIEFDPVRFRQLTPGAEIEITYSMLFTGFNGIDSVQYDLYSTQNVAWVEYSKNPHNSSIIAMSANTSVYITNGLFSIYKYTGAYGDDSEMFLPGAEFELRTNHSDPSSAVEFVLDDGVYRPAMDGETGDTTLVSGADGLIYVSGLSAKTRVEEYVPMMYIYGAKPNGPAHMFESTYYLVETKAPDGYNIMDDYITIKICALTTATELFTMQYAFYLVGEEVTSFDTEMARSSPIPVQNSNGTQFPETGGVGRTIFIIAGLTIMAGAGVALTIRKTRMDSRG